MALLLLLRQRLVLTMRDTLMIIAMSLLIISFYSYGYSYSYSQMQVQPPTADMITYSKQSNFIKEFNIPNNIQELGLKGITIDSDRNAWFYHTTNKTTKIIKFEPENENFTQYNVTGNTVVDNAIINLAGGQLIFDKERSIIWFTDARTNSIGKLDTGVGKIELVSIPTPNAGPMGITLSQMVKVYGSLRLQETKYQVWILNQKKSWNIQLERKAALLFWILIMQAYCGLPNHIQMISYRLNHGCLFPTAIPLWACQLLPCQSQIGFLHLE
jgi:hypothetical protein